MLHEIFETTYIPDRNDFAVIIDEHRLNFFKYFYKQKNRNFDVIDEKLGT